MTAPNPSQNPTGEPKKKRRPSTRKHPQASAEERQRRAARMSALGSTHEEIAAELDVARTTISTYVHSEAWADEWEKVHDELRTAAVDTWRRVAEAATTSVLDDLRSSDPERRAVARDLALRTGLGKALADLALPTVSRVEVSSSTDAQVAEGLAALAGLLGDGEG